MSAGRLDTKSCPRSSGDSSMTRRRRMTDGRGARLSANSMEKSLSGVITTWPSESARSTMTGSEVLSSSSSPT